MTQPSDTWINIGSESHLQHLASMYMYSCWQMDKGLPFYVQPSYARWAADVALNGPTAENNGLGNEEKMIEALEDMLGRNCCGQNSVLMKGIADADAHKALLTWWLKFSKEILEGRRG